MSKLRVDGRRGVVDAVVKEVEHEKTKTRQTKNNQLAMEIIKSYIIYK